MAELVIASNRGPVSVRPHEPGGVPLTGGGGGLVTGVARSLRGVKGDWVFAVDEVDHGACPRAGRRGLAGSSVGLHRVELDPDDFEPYYGAISNELLWPVHVGVSADVPEDTLDPISPVDPACVRGWEAYRRVNRDFAICCDDHLDHGGQAFIHDFHLGLVPAMLRQRRPDVSIAHFTHCPWAQPSEFARLPKAIAEELLRGMLEANLVCFYVPRWAQAFLRCCDDLGYVVDWAEGVVEGLDSRPVPVRAYPLGVDSEELRREVATEAVQQHRRWLRDLKRDCSLVVRVERADPVKNVLRGLEAFELFLEQNPTAHGRVIHFALTYLTRRHVPGYAAYADQVAERVQRINNRFGGRDWKPIILQSRPSYPLGLAAMSLADVLVVNSLRDGMNLVAKEGPAVNERDCILILSLNAGVAEEVGNAALLVDPLDTAALAASVATALAMPREERRHRAALIRNAATALTPTRWLDQQRSDLLAAQDGSWTHRPLAGRLPLPEPATHLHAGVEGRSSASG